MANASDPSEKPSVWQVYKVPILLGGCSFLLIVLSLYLLIKTYQAPDPIQFLTVGEQQATSSGTQSVLFIDVSGAVVKSGLYQLPFGSRVDDAIVAAGGMTKEADIEKIATSINRAAKLSDGAKVYIPKKTEAENDQSSTETTTTVSINSASSADLERLNGIGPATATKIIAGRPYTRIEELVEKKAISQGLFEKLKALLTL